MSSVNLAPNVIMIPANPEFARVSAVRRQLRVAAYCRVSTDSEEQLTSYEAQRTYYTDKIMANPEWTMAGLFADEGITGTSAQKRPEFLRMIRQCRQKKIDLVLTKSISRFARNTVDSLKYIRVLKELGIAVIFEEQNINTLESDNEMLLTIHSAFSQAESETMSSRVKWGKREAMREGRAIIQYNRLYGYRRGENNKPEIIPEQAEVVQRIYKQYLTGASLRMIQDTLESEQIPNVEGKSEWSLNVIRGILTNEKYYGDVLMQKTYVNDCISRKTIRNNGQLPKYLLPDHHEGIVDRQTFDAVQTEMARRNAGRSPSRKNAPTGRTSYASKYALSERLVCGECGTLYRRCVWVKKGQRFAVWRCASRIDYGTKYCHDSPSMDEDKLHQAILEGINEFVQAGQGLGDELLDLASIVQQGGSADGIDPLTLRNRLDALTAQQAELLDKVLEDMGNLELNAQLKALAEEKQSILDQMATHQQDEEKQALQAARQRERDEWLEQRALKFTQYEDIIIRSFVEKITVVDAETVLIKIRDDDVEIEQSLC